MDTLFERIVLAKNCNSELDSLISDYIPFIKKTINDTGDPDIEYDDKLSLALLCFMNCVKQYELERGNFIAFTASCIRNRLIDESRSRVRYVKKIIPFLQSGDGGIPEIENAVSLAVYNKEQEQESLCIEIDNLSAQLGRYGISFGELPLICPKHNRARKKCYEISDFITGNEDMLQTFFRTQRLAQSELARHFDLSEKTIEKHRKYIVTLVLLLTGDYPYIRTFLPQYKELKK